ncbi:MAG: VCBS repeat-containing protein [Bryobacteraceae bacterium]
MADLFIANYVQWTAKGDLWCSLDGATKSYCTPESYKGNTSKLYRNTGNGRFEDITVKAGLGDRTSKSLGVAVFDYNADGWPDLFVANDTQPNKLYRKPARVRSPKGGECRRCLRRRRCLTGSDGRRCR